MNQSPNCFGDKRTLYISAVGSAALRMRNNAMQHFLIRSVGL